jgi:Hydrolytic ATP binding site of dynein motor region
MNMANEVLSQIMNAFVAVSSSISLLGEKLRIDSSGLYIATVSSNSIALTGSKSCQLPRYLAAQYRTVGVGQPPLRLVAEMILLSEGLSFSLFYFGDDVYY